MSQSLSSVLVHTIFSTKLRNPLIKKEIRSDLYAYIAGISQKQKSYVHEIGGVDDHVHMLITLPRTIALSDLLEEIKKSSSKFIKTRGPEYREFSWQKCYGAFSIGQSGYENLRKYIQNQEEHHKKVSFQDKFRSFLKKYNVSFDENYVWD